MKIHLMKFLVIPVMMTGMISCMDQGVEDIDTDRFTDWLVTDRMIEEGIMAELNGRPEISAEDVSVEVFNGIAKLSGSTGNLYQRERIEEVTGTIKGVKGIVDQITLSAEPVSDEELVRNVEAALYHDPVTESFEYEIQASEGKVTVQGIVDSWQEVVHGEDVIQSVPGVRAVVNNVNFKYPESSRSDLEILAEINRILHEDLYLEADEILVEVEAGEVRLFGDVGCESERNRAVTRSYVPGVDTVLGAGLEFSQEARDPRLRRDHDMVLSDEKIREAILTTFIVDERVKGVALDAQVYQGAVRLTGRLKHETAMNVVLNNVKHVNGVESIQNDMEYTDQMIPEDQILAEKVLDALNFHPFLDKFDLDIQIDAGTVEIQGNINSSHDEDMVLDVISGVAGVKEIRNMMNVDQIDPMYRAIPQVT